MPDRVLTCSRIVPNSTPSKPTWFQRLPEILDRPRHMDATHLDRRPIEQLFGTGTDEDGN